mgnify:FL=1
MGTRVHEFKVSGLVPETLDQIFKKEQYEASLLEMHDGGHRALYYFFIDNDGDVGMHVSNDRDNQDAELVGGSVVKKLLTDAGAKVEGVGYGSSL